MPRIADTRWWRSIKSKMSSFLLGLQGKDWWKLVPQETIDRLISPHSKNAEGHWSPTAALHPLKHLHSIRRKVSLIVKWGESCKITLCGASRHFPSNEIRSMEYRLRRILLTGCPRALSGVLVTSFTKSEDEKDSGKIEEKVYSGLLLSGVMTTRLVKIASLQLFKKNYLYLFNNLRIYVLCILIGRFLFKKQW